MPEMTIETLKAVQAAQDSGSSPGWLGASCVECRVGIYRPTNEAHAIPIEIAWTKKLSMINGYVFLLVAFALMVVGLVDLLGISLDGPSPFLFPASMLGVLAGLMIRWGRLPATNGCSDLLCNKCGLAPRAQGSERAIVKVESARHD